MTSAELVKLNPTLAAKHGIGKKRKPKRPRQPNSWERDYAKSVLDPLVDVGVIQYYGYEVHKIILPDGVVYTPDFFVLYARVLRSDTPRMEFHEVKGRHRDGGIVRFRIARGMVDWAELKMFKRVGPGRFEEMEV